MNPSTNKPGDPGRTRNVRTSLNDDFKYLSSEGSDRTVDEQYTQNAYTDKTLGPVGLGTAKAQPAKPQENLSNRPADNVRRSQEIRRSARERLAGKLLPSSLTQAKTMVARARASAINVSALSWQGPLWLFVQLPIALLNIMMIAIVYALDQVEDAAAEGGVAAWIISRVTEAISAVASFFGIDFLEIAASMYLLTSMLLWGIALISVLALYLQYTMGMLRPLSGEGMGLKFGLLLLAYIGYSLPIANLFPCVFLWMFAVWLYPR